MKIKKRTKMKLLAAAVALLLSLAIFSAVATPKQASPYAKLELFAKVLIHLERYYVEPIDEQEVMIGAIEGMMRTVDPHSSFLTPDEYELLEADTRGQFGGIGVEVSIRDAILTVITPMPDSPAERGGIEPGDFIVAVEGKSTAEMSLEDMVRLMRGEVGTSVTITIQRGNEKPFEVTLQREIIKVESVEAELLLPGYPWIRVQVFQDGTSAEVLAAIDELTAESGDLKGIVLDLRRNPGGVLDEAVRLADLFVAEGTLLSTRGRGDIVLHEYNASRAGTLTDPPLVCLIDGGSASASEIVAGALQDHGRALLVGMKSFGKGSVQSIIGLGDGYGMKLTVARYFTPNGRSIQAEGVKPDVIVGSLNPPEPDEETLALSAAPDESGLPGHLAALGSDEKMDEDIEIEDYQLQIAFQLLRGIARQQENQQN